MASAATHAQREHLRWRLPPVSRATAFGLRYGLGVCAAIWIGHLPGLVTNESQWILITVLMVAQPNTGGSLLKGLLRAVGTAAAAFTAILLFGGFSQDPPLLLAGLLLVQGVAAYGFTGPRFQYAWFVWAFTTAIVLGAAMSGTENVETLAFQRASMVWIGLLIVVVLDSTLWPDRSETTLRQSLAQRARQVASTLRNTLAGASGATSESQQESPSPLADQLALAGAVRTEIGVSASRAEALTHASLLLEALASRERVLRETRDAAPAPSGGPQDELGSCVHAALEASAAAVAANRAPARYGEQLDTALARAQDASAGHESTAGDRVGTASRAADLRSLVGLLNTLEQVLVGLATGEGRDREGASAPAARVSFDSDPLRVQLAIRTAVAVGAVFVAMLSFGWGINTLAAPIAFMVACTPTRGAATKLAAVVTGAVLFAWLLADLAIVSFYTAVAEIPAALVFPFAVAAALGYLRVVRPKLGAIVPILALLSILPIFSGTTAPTDVYGPYSTACYVVLAVAIAWATTRLFWPATAAALFRRRAATQLTLCAQTVKASALADEAARRRRGTSLLAAYTTQLAQLGPLHEQARLEPAESALDDPRRARLLALTQGLFDQALRERHALSELEAHSPDDAAAALAPLFDALRRQDDALVDSVNAAARALRDSPIEPGPALRDARAEVEACLEALRGRTDLARTVATSTTNAFLAAIAARRSLVHSQLALEDWLIDWRKDAFDFEAPRGNTRFFGMW